ncbi:hypothetical protein [Limosilactobacillus fermentum]
MIELMQAWTRIRLSGRHLLGQDAPLELEDGNQPKYKRRVHKINGTSNHRASRH